MAFFSSVSRKVVVVPMMRQRPFLPLVSPTIGSPVFGSIQSFLGLPFFLVLFIPIGEQEPRKSRFLTEFLTNGVISIEMYWRRGDLNPSPVTTSEAASTCIVDGLISIPAANVDILRRGPVVLISPCDQRPNHKASPHFAADVTRASHRAEVALIRQPYEPGRQ
jgi:hypothetical protein